ncbi:MAG: class I SAM-dependent methyltransferase [Syntrophobacteraceae bacterium]
MKHKTLEYLICPGCLPEENSLRLGDCRIADGEIVEGNLECGCCGSLYPIREGIACLMAKEGEKAPLSVYETPEVLSTYLWTHYADLFGDPDASVAYTEWAAQIEPVSGAVLDTGCAVGRFSFEMSVKCDMVIGVDVSMSFVATARRLLRERQLTFSVKEEGLIHSEKSFRLRPEWDPEKVDFVAADATALPFRSGSFGCVASLNVIDKVPRPLQHVRELCRTARPQDAQLFLSDPFSWSETICAPEKWLGGVREGRFAGAGLDNLARLISEGNELSAHHFWRIARRGAVWWKIRNHRNHFELVRSQFLKAQR